MMRRFPVFSIGVILVLGSGLPAFAGTTVITTFPLVQQSQVLPSKVEDSASGKKFEITADRKSVRCTKGGELLWETRILSDKPELKTHMGTKKNVIQSFTLNDLGTQLSVIVPGDALMCWYDINTLTGKPSFGGCD